MRPASVAVALAAVLLAWAAPATASPSARFGIQDDAWLLYGPGSPQQRVATLQSLGVGVVRLTLRWDQIARHSPVSPRDPSDPAYSWSPYDTVLQALHAKRIPVLLTLYGAPRWSNGGGGPATLPLTPAIGDFAYAAAKRFPWVHLWTVWNEPNGRTFSVPVSPSLYVRLLLNPAYDALHAAGRGNQVAGGVTSPRQPPSGLSPIAFMQGMAAARAKLDAYAQNPYPVERGETPTRTTCSYCDELTMAKLSSIREDVTRYFGSKPLWLTEYGYQTNPPDRLLGVSLALQAQYIGEAALRVWHEPGVTMLIQFLVQDEPSLGGWQSGLLTVTGNRKPSYHAFSLPLAEVSRSGSAATFWGQVRVGSGARPYVLQRRSGSRWVTLASARTGRAGTFTRTVPVAVGDQVRLWAPKLGYAGQPIHVS